MSLLSVSDIERLVRAGVTTTFQDIAMVVVPDAPSPSPAPLSYDPYRSALVEAFWQRWDRAHSIDRDRALMVQPYEIHAQSYAETVYVMVCPRSAPPFIIEDHAGLYPSDALMAKLLLYEGTR